MLARLQQPVYPDAVPGTLGYAIGGYIKTWMVLVAAIVALMVMAFFLWPKSKREAFMRRLKKKVFL
jgi:hypothetical protein